ncbi:1,4-alpha-glucan branching protein GlgB [Thalassotalea ponticola]|uniref:1,4-alpha-glucan branching protein GlgB n=1 Tax=Thalassotalea ponticola TaxID=1523392 RepID=UPI0025B4D907|nr:1,4-alpha-glucan branching protein GlgB [Thalassotalea ponticola]MDN3652504.1 1,4-alpha-glucan branching protein GlgB [Thalassotalea ponticola]
MQQDIDAILQARHPNPFGFLGMHANAQGYLQINCFVQDAISVSVVDTNGKVVARLDKVDEAGLFTKVTRRKKHFTYLLKAKFNDGEKTFVDPFSCTPVLGDLDICLFNEGKHKRPYQKLGAHVIEHDGVKGVSFAVWAPNASSVSVVGDFNRWDGRVHPLRKRVEAGIWEIFIPHNSCANGIAAGNHYKFEIKDQYGHLLPLKADPYGAQAQFRPDTSSVISAPSEFDWQDDAWLNSRAARNAYDAPMSIYEVHLGSWQRDDNNQFLNYRELADRLIPYTLQMGFTHIQLMPVSEYPFDGSWGYQPVGLFAPTARFGSAQDFKYFVDACHSAGLGLLIDWVPGHFPVDAHGLSRFDGTCLYEHEDVRKGFHPDWNTLIYNYGRTEVTNFLCASAMHWLDNYHIDGIRVDAVASMLYLDYSRKEGEWLPNEHGGNENLEAVAFLQQFNEQLYADYPGAFSVAEESTSWPGVSKPTSMGGLGFGYKWNMGWMNDTLQYMGRDPIHRQYHHSEISFGLVYAFDENFILPLSHDEVVHGKGSILARMPGDEWQRFANLRAYYSFMWTHPGKKLLFMGCEFGQANEWNFDQSLDWHLLEHGYHQGVQQLIKDLNRLYKETPALHQLDCQAQGFAWVDHENAGQSVYSYIRYGKDGSNPVLVVCNFTPTVHHQFRLGVPKAGYAKEIFNSDASIYGGSNVGNLDGVHSQANQWQGFAQSIDITVPPLATVVFELR